MTAGVSTARNATELDLAFSSERAFRDWYDRTLPRVYGYVLGHTAGDTGLAEEITQQTFVDALRDHARVLRNAPAELRRRREAVGAEARRRIDDAHLRARVAERGGVAVRRPAARGQSRPPDLCRRPRRRRASAARGGGRNERG